MWGFFHNPMKCSGSLYGCFQKWGYHHFRKHPYPIIPFKSSLLKVGWQNPHMATLWPCQKMCLALGFFWVWNGARFVHQRQPLPKWRNCWWFRNPAPPGMYRNKTLQLISYRLHVWHDLPTCSINCDPNVGKYSCPIRRIWEWCGPFLPTDPVVVGRLVATQIFGSGNSPRRFVMQV